MSTQKAKFALIQKLTALGFTYDEAQALRRIEMTLQRWAEAECNGDIQRDDDTAKPFRFVSDGRGAIRSQYPIADREAGALRRLKAIVEARNKRMALPSRSPLRIESYHQTDPRGCSLYLITRAQLDGKPIDQVYNRGLAVCCS